MFWANFLHIYQPADQTKEILTAVANQSYRRLFVKLHQIPKIKLTLNINAALAETLLENGFNDIIEQIKVLADEGKLEFTESAKYHAFLPLLDEREITRQIAINHQANKKIFGDHYRPQCFFSPEMAYSEKVSRAAARLGYSLIILDEISYNGRTEKVPYDRLFQIKDFNLLAVFRQRRMSNLIMSGVVRDQSSFFEALGEQATKKEYLLTAMDGETFGHHRPGLEQFLFEILRATQEKQIFVSEIPRHFETTGEISPVEATWASSEDDLRKHKQFFSWKDPENKIHCQQWQLLNFVLQVLRRQKTECRTARAKVDIALASDQFFWASGEPWWSIEMIEKGAWRLLDALESILGASKKESDEGKKIYNSILADAFAWQRKGKIELLAGKYRQAIKIPFKERTLEADKPEVWQAFIRVMQKKMREAAAEQNFEKAILWRDAIWKLETKNDLYDVIHVTDLLRQEVVPGELEKLMDQYKETYRQMKSGQPELRGVSQE